MQGTNILTLLIILMISSLGVKAYQDRLLETTTYVTNPERGYTVTGHCDSKVNRLELYSTYGLEGDIPHGGTVSSTFNLDTYSFV